MIPEINLTAEPEQFRKHPKFVEAFDGLQLFLSLPKEVDTFCIHEGAHIVYFAKAGIATKSINGPRVVPNFKEDRFDGYPVSLETDNPKFDPQNLDEEYMQQVARALAAGGCAAIEIGKAKRGGDSTDETNFHIICTEGGISADETKERWQKAKDQVTEHLRTDPALVNEIRAKGEEIRAIIFGTVGHPQIPG